VPARTFGLLLLAAVAGADPAVVPEPVAARRARRDRLRDHLVRDYALVLGQPMTDVLSPRQEGHFLYLTGVDDPGAALLLAGTKAPQLKIPRGKEKVATREALLLVEAGDGYARFYGQRYRPGATAERELGLSTFPAARKDDELGRAIGALLPKRARLHVPAYRGPDDGLVRERRATILAALEEARPGIVVEDLYPTLRDMRAVKDALEVQSVRRAVDVTLAAFRDALAEMRPGSSEALVDGVLLLGVRRRGALPAYPFVVATGANATIPHYFRNSAALADGDLLLIDAGGAVDRYAADVTRTFPVSGRFSPRQREVYEAVLEAQLAGIAAVKPGATLKEVDAAARGVLKAKGLAAYFIHGTSHHVGLDVHDPGVAKLAPGMVITVEPGVYIGEEGLGIRIEDTVLVTGDGAEVLSGGLPKSTDEIERLIADARPK